MRRTMTALAAGILAIGTSLPAVSEPTQVTLADYAFDFPAHGFEIEFSGTTQNLVDKLTADDHITIEDNGYKMRTLIDRMGRKDRQAFIRFFNAGCIGFMPTDACLITATGEVELDDDMKMIFRISTATIRKGGNEWSNSEGN